MKKTVLILLITTLLIVVAIWISPYNYYSQRDGWAIVETIEVEVPAKELYSYLGNSSNASDWSSYVSHINLLNGDEVKDGEEGSRRRCYQKENNAVAWDELIVKIKPEEYRKLSIYNLRGFPLECGALVTEQIYNEKSPKSTMVSLTLFADPDKATFVDHFKLWFASFTVSPIFKANLQTIKEINEN